MYTSSVALTLHTSTAIIERCLDLSGYIPGVSLLNLPLRVAVAALQALCALGSAIYLGLLHLKRFEKKANIAQEQEEWSNHMAYFFTNAFQNVCRGSIEHIPVIGNVTCFMWDWPKSLLSSRELEGSFGPIGDEDWHRPLIANIQ